MNPITNRLRFEQQLQQLMQLSLDDELYTSIGQITDNFASVYCRIPIAEPCLVAILWRWLFTVFTQSQHEDNRYDAISAMHVINLYQHNLNQPMDKSALANWLNSHTDEMMTLEIREIIEDILSY